MLVYLNHKKMLAYCDNLRIEVLYLIGSPGLKIGNWQGIFSCRGSQFNWVIVSDNLGILDRFDSLEDAEAELVRVGKLAEAGKLIEFSSGYLDLYPEDEYDYEEIMKKRIKEQNEDNANYLK